MELDPVDTRAFLFHGPNARQESGAAMDAVNAWLGKDRAHEPYAMPLAAPPAAPER